MATQVLSNIQIVTLFDESTSTQWTYQINLMKNTIQVYQEQTKLAVFSDCRLPVTVDYLESLSQQTNNVRTIQ